MPRTLFLGGTAELLGRTSPGTPIQPASWRFVDSAGGGFQRTFNTKNHGPGTPFMGIYETLLGGEEDQESHGLRSWDFMRLCGGVENLQSQESQGVREILVQGPPAHSQESTGSWVKGPKGFTWPM